MKKRMSTGIMTMSLAAMLTLLGGTVARAQSAFFQAVTNLHPVAYWPLQETVAPPAADVEPDLGLAGAVANAYYSSTNVQRGIAGATGDGDAAVQCDGSGGSFLAVPTTDPQTVIPAGPFTVEVWINPADYNNYRGIVSQSGPNPGGLNNSTYRGGWVLSQNYYAYLDSASLHGFSFHVYNGQGAGNGLLQGGAEAGIVLDYQTNTWYYLVGVYDGTNCTFYVNGVDVATLGSGYSVPMTGSYVPDNWDPLTIGCGRGINNNRFGGGIDEVAIYTNALTATQVQNHYSAASGSTYSSTVLGDSPYMYWRMDAPVPATSPVVSDYPSAANYGSGVGLDGLYLSGTTPGLPGPSYPGLGSPSYACGFNGIGTDATNEVPIYTNGVAIGANVANSGVLITNQDDALINDNTNSLSMICWFKGNPADNRFQGIFGHGDHSWRMAMGSGGAAGTVRFNPGAGSDLQSDVYNDGNWHFAAAISEVDPVAGMVTNYLYIDGVLNTMDTNNALPTGSITNVLLGGAPDYAVSGNGGVYRNRFFAGSLAQVAYFTNALTAAQIVNLYTNATAGGPPPPVITAQPYSYPLVRNVVGGPGTYMYEAVVAYGNTPLSYQWYYNSSSNYSGATLLTDGAKYSSATTLQVTVTNLADSDSGYYFAVVSDPFGGSVTSAIVNVEVTTKPVITAQSPTGAFSLFTGQSTTLSVTASGAADLIYQWYTNGVADANGTNNTYVATGDQSGDTYQCVVTNTYGAATSIVDTVTVQAMPAFVTNSLYSSNVLALQPTAYWPMHEVAVPAGADIETNYGTLGAVGNGYYADWNLNGGFPGNDAVIHQVPGALTNDPDGAAHFENISGGYSYLLVPHTSPGTTLRPPFTVECWVWSTSTGFGDMISQDGTKLNGGNANNQEGFRISWNRGNNIQTYGTAGGLTGGTTPLYQWHHVVVTYDGTNQIMYVNGGEANRITHTGYVVDYWDPLTIGAGLWNAGGPTRYVPLAMDEVAVYTNILTSTEVFNHYNDGVNGTNGQYFADVMSLNPVLYYRMDSPAYSGVPNISTWPVMTNYGTVAVNGNYRPGLAAGSVSGPDNGGGLNAGGLFATNAAPCNGLSTFAEAYDANVFNVPYNEADPGSDTPLTISAWFRGNPTDSRFQSIVSHGQGSWQINQGTDGTLRFNTGGTALNSLGSYNDGTWHFVVATHSGTNNAIYVDGALDISNSNDAYTNGVGSANNACVGCDPSFIDSNKGAGRQYAGNVCEVAFWNGTALNASQVQALYAAAEVPPKILQQPVSANVNQNSDFTNTTAVMGATLAYQWYFNSSSNYAGATALADGSSGHGSTYAGTTTDSLAINNVQPGDAGYYYMVVTNGGGSVTSDIVELTVNSAPEIIQQPPVTNMMIFMGGHIALPVQAVGAEPLHYQWYTNGIADSSTAGTNATYIYSPILYNLSVYCAVSNVAGAATSSVVTVTAIAAPTAPYPAKVLADNPYGLWRMNEPTNGLNNGNAGVVAHDYWGGNNGVYTNVDLGDPGYAPVTEPTETSALFGQTGISFIDSYAGEIQGIDFAAPTNSSSDFSIEAWVKGGSQTINGAGVVTKGYGNGGEQFNLDVYANHYRFFVRDANGGVHGYTSSVSPDGQWHHVVGVCDESGGTVTLYLDGQALGSGTIVPGTGILESTNVMSIGARRSGAGTNNYDLQFYGNVDDVAVYNYALSPEQVRSHWSAPGVPPAMIEAPPSTVSVNEGGTLTLPAAGIGTPPLTNTWFDTFNFTNVSQTVVTGTNYTDATLVVSNVPVDWDFDTLQLTIANAYGSVSTNVTLTVNSGPPLIVQDLPTPVTAVAGRPYTYTLVVQGTEPLHYQWKSNGVDVAGQDVSSYTFSAATANYSVVVTNVYGAATSTVSAMTAVSTPTNAYANYVLTTLGAAGYWPLQETTAPSIPTIETNYGTLGILGTGYYAGTNANATGVAGASVSFGQTPGALTNSGDLDPATGFLGGNNKNETNSYLVVPRLSPALDFTAPVTYECWVYGGSGDFSDVLGNGGLDGDGSGNWSGLRISYSRGTAIQAYWYPGTGSTLASMGTPTGSYASTWHYVALTYDGTTMTMYIDGTNAVSTAATVAPNHWTPMSIGCGRWDGSHETRAYNGLIDEVAFYSNALSAAQVMAHYQAAITPGSNYVQAVTQDNPLVYYRMDGVYTNPNPAFAPTALNFGAVGIQGNYQAGVVPGAVSGPSNATFGTNEVAAPINGMFSCVDAKYNSAFDPTGTQPFTAMTWFKGYPWDARTQTIMGQGGNWSMNIDGASGLVVWNLYSGGQVTSTTVLNDGNWHFIAGVYDGTNSYLYVDGALDNSGAATAGLDGDTNANLYLGGNYNYSFTQVQSGQRYLAGALAQAAYFTNALTADEIGQVYNLAGLAVGVQPTISLQLVGGQLEVTYTGRLLSSTSVAGPYTAVSGAPSVGSLGHTIIVSPSGGQLFYRAVNP